MLFAVIFPLIVGIGKYRNLNKGLKFLFFFVCLGTLTELTIHVFIALGYTTNQGISYYLPAEFFLFSLMYADFLKGVIKAKYIYILIGLFTVYSVIYIIFFHQSHLISNFSMAIRNIIYLIYAILYFYKVLTDLKLTNLWNEPMFWINIAVLFIFSTNLFVFVFFNRIINMPENISLIITYIQSINWDIGYIIMGIGLLKVKKITS